MFESEFLVKYGHGGYLGRFRAAAEYRRDDRVIVRSPRGVEIGTVLATAATQIAGIEPSGEILRTAASEDETAATAHQDRASAILNDAHQSAEAIGLPLMFLDGEVLLRRPAPPSFKPFTGRTATQRHCLNSFHVNMVFWSNLPI